MSKIGLGFRNWERDADVCCRLRGKGVLLQGKEKYVNFLTNNGKRKDKNCKTLSESTDLDSYDKGQQYFRV